ncbi:unnamed protein product [Lactuca saligna]|uniref:Uncharacterized protein n=1 Tax=Lactuca saligna TaxID=75948 RepID=A0AA36A4B7_LACSI|nr:unnamed protein product [Lactuca saligna]
MPTGLLGVSQFQPPLFTDSTTTTTTSTIDPPINVNASNTRTSDLGLLVGNTSPPISPFTQDDPDTIFSGDDDDFARFSYSPFNIQTESDHGAPITRGKLKAINEKLNLLLQSSKASSSEDYSQVTIKSFLETFTKEHSANLEKTNKALYTSASVCNEMIEKVDKLITDACSFIEKFHSSC